MMIRRATVDDADRIALLHTESWQATYKGIMSEAFLTNRVVADRQHVWRERLGLTVPHQEVFLVVEQEQAQELGFVCAVGNHDAQWGTLVDNLHVRRTEHGKGLGKWLMHHVAVWSQERYPHCGMYLHVVKENLQARRFYEQLGGQAQPSEPWQAPDGSLIEELLYVWRTTEHLLALQNHVHGK